MLSVVVYHFAIVNFLLLKYTVFQMRKSDVVFVRAMNAETKRAAESLNTN